MNLKNRIEAIEARTGSGEDDDAPEGIFFLCSDGRVGAPPPGPLLGWRVEHREYLRQLGESDEQLEARAIESEKPYLFHPLAIQSFFSIHSNDQ